MKPRGVCLSHPLKKDANPRVTLDGDWDDGHGRSADFRDGELVEFRVDG